MQHVLGVGGRAGEGAGTDRKPRRTETEGAGVSPSRKDGVRARFGGHTRWLSRAPWTAPGCVQDTECRRRRGLPGPHVAKPASPPALQLLWKQVWIRAGEQDVAFSLCV